MQSTLPLAVIPLSPLDKLLRNQRLICDKHKLRYPHLVYRTNMNSNLVYLQKILLKHDTYGVPLSGGTQGTFQNINKVKKVPKTPGLAFVPLNKQITPIPAPTTVPKQIFSPAVILKRLTPNQEIAAQLKIHRKDTQALLKQDIENFNQYDAQIRGYLRTRFINRLASVPARASMWGKVSGSMSKGERARQSVMREMFAAMTCMVGDQTLEKSAALEKEVQALNEDIAVVATPEAEGETNEDTDTRFSRVFGNLQRLAPLLLPQYNRGCGKKIKIPHVDIKRLMEAPPIRRLLGPVRLIEQEFSTILHILLRIALQMDSNAIYRTKLTANPRWLVVLYPDSSLFLLQMDIILRHLRVSDQQPKRYFQLCLLTQLLNRTVDRLDLTSQEKIAFRVVRELFERVYTFSRTYVPSIVDENVETELFHHLTQAQQYFTFVSTPINWDGRKISVSSGEDNGLHPTNSNRHQGAAVIALATRIRGMYTRYTGQQLLNDHHQQQHRTLFGAVVRGEPGNLLELIQQLATFYVENDDDDNNMYNSNSPERIAALSVQSLQ